MNNQRVPELTRLTVLSRWPNTLVKVCVVLCMMLASPSDTKADTLSVEFVSLPPECLCNGGVIYNYTPNLGSIQCDATTSLGSYGRLDALAYSAPGLTAGVFASVTQYGAYTFDAVARAVTYETLYFTHPGFAEFAFGVDGFFLGGAFADPSSNQGIPNAYADTSFGLIVWGNSGGVGNISTTQTLAHDQQVLEVVHTIRLGFDSSHPLSLALDLRAEAHTARSPYAFNLTDFRADALVDFSHTVSLSSINLTDASGNPISAQDAGLSSASGFDYSSFVNADASVPEPGTMSSTALGGILLLVGSLRKRK